MRVNLTFALNLPGDSSAVGLPGPVLPDIGTAIEGLPDEAGVSAGFAGLLAGLSVDPESGADPMPTPQLPQSEAGVPDGTAPVAEIADTADGKALPVAPGKALPDELAPLQFLPTQALQKSSPARPARPDPAIAGPPEHPQQGTKAAIAQGDILAPSAGQVAKAPVTPAPALNPQSLHLQLTARTLAPEQANEARAPSAPDTKLTAMAEPLDKFLKDGASKPAVDAPRSEVPRKSLAVQAPDRADPQSADTDTGDDANPARKTAKAQSAPSTTTTQPATQSPTLPASSNVTNLALPTTPAAAAEPATAAQRPTGAIQPQDFDAIVQRLGEAREAARPGEANLRVLTREFGHVAMQFEVAGRALRVSLASRDADFAPAVQAALAERGPLVVAEAVRAESTPGRGEHGTQQNGSQTSGQSSPGSNTGQNASQNGAARTPQPGSIPEKTDRNDAANARDDGLFA